MRGPRHDFKIRQPRQGESLIDEEQLAKLAKELIGGESGSMDLLIIEAPRGKADTPEKAMDFAKELSGDESAEEAVEEASEEEPMEVSEPEEDSPEGPLHAAVSDLIIQWNPETPEEHRN